MTPFHLPFSVVSPMWWQPFALPFLVIHLLFGSTGCTSEPHVRPAEPLATHSAIPKFIPLTLKAVYVISSPFPIEPSGLTLRDGRLLTVCDKNDGVIYEIMPLDLPSLSFTQLTHLPNPDSILTVREAVIREAFFYQLPERFTFLSKLDIEGITFTETDERFFLASESYSKIFAYTPKTGSLLPLTPDLKPLMKNYGILQRFNAGLEGIAALGSDEFLLCAERNQNGIIWIKTGSDTTEMDFRVFKLNETSVQLGPKRTPDFSDIVVESKSPNTPLASLDDWRIFVLFRGAESILEVSLQDNLIRETAYWSFESISNYPDFRYQDTTYGIAEGLCMDSSYIYLIVDNNQDSRERHPNDKRPLLFIFHRPDTAVATEP